MVTITEKAGIQEKEGAEMKKKGLIQVQERSKIEFQISTP